MADPTFTESTLPTAVIDDEAQGTRRTLGDVSRPHIRSPPQSPSMASESGACAPTPPDIPTDQKWNDQRPLLLSSGTIRLIRQTAVGAVNELVKSSVDSKLVSFREELLSQVRSMMSQDPRDGTSPTEISGMDPSHKPRSR